MSEHGLDAEGLVLPDPGWPADRQAPGELERLRRFVNTTNLETGAEAWRRPGDLAAWLPREGWPSWEPTVGDLDRLVRLRALLREVISSRRDDSAGIEAEVVRAAFGAVTVRVELTGAGPQLVCGEAGCDGLVGSLAIIAAEAVQLGTWGRLVSCANDHCRWIVYDHSKNRSGTWCSMSACGSRRKARAYRARQRR